MASEQTAHDTILEGGTVIDPATGRNGRFDVGVGAGRISAIEPSLVPGGGTNVVDVAGKLVIAGMIDTHAHIYEHVTGKFGLNADMVGVRSASTTLVDQGGPSCMTIRGFRHFVAEPASSRVLAFISSYLVGGLEGHYYPELYGPGGVNVEHTVRAIDENRDIVKGVKSHAEIGGASRWGLEVVRLGQRIAREADVPLYIHLGQLWPTARSHDHRCGRIRPRARPPDGRGRRARPPVHPSPRRLRERGDRRGPPGDLGGPGARGWWWTSGTARTSASTWRGAPSTPGSVRSPSARTCTATTSACPSPA